MPPPCPHCGTPARSAQQVNAAIRRLMRGARGRGLTAAEAEAYRVLLAEWARVSRVECLRDDWARAA